MRIFDKNQGEKLRTQIDIDHAARQKDAAEAQVFSDVDSAYFTLVSALDTLRPYKDEDGYLDTAARVRETMSFAYQRGQAALVDYLDAQRDYRATQVCLHQSGGRVAHRRRATEHGRRTRSHPVKSSGDEVKIAFTPNGE